LSDCKFYDKFNANLYFIRVFTSVNVLIFFYNNHRILHTFNGMECEWWPYKFRGI